MFSQNYYEILGVDSKFSSDELRKNWKLLNRQHHPDKGGDKDVMVLINKAYDVLRDPEKKKKYDTYLQTNPDAEEKTNSFYEHLSPANVDSYAQKFKELHKSFVTQYQKNPSATGNSRDHFSHFSSNIYSEKLGDEKDESSAHTFSDVYSYIAYKNSKGQSSSYFDEKNDFTVKKGIKVLIDFLSGKYYGQDLTLLKDWLKNRFKSIQPNNADYLFFEGIIEIILMSEKNPQDHHMLLFAIVKIVDFTKTKSEPELSDIVPLLFNKYFRNLFNYAIHLFWQSNFDILANDHLKKLDGQQKAKDLLQVLRKYLITNDKPDSKLTEIIRRVSFLMLVENELQKLSDEPTAVIFREKAFHLLNLIPALSENANEKMIVNFLIQIGIHFQRASRIEQDHCIKMADEAVALQIYLFAIGTSHSSPDGELYAKIHILKCISMFEYQHPSLKPVIEALQKRTKVVADVFPIFEDLQSIIHIYMCGEKSFYLMRYLLNTLLNILEQNKKLENPVLIDHTAVTILYQVYEASLNNWYQKKYDHEFEKEIRRKLMEELLSERGWNSVDVDENLDKPYILIDRDNQGWLVPIRELPFNADKQIEKFVTLYGAEINPVTGELNFFLEPWRDKHSPHEKLFTQYDLQQIILRGLEGAWFSLEAVEPNKRFHPFNQMLFGPHQLDNTELFNCMLMTDYILKMLTTNQEIQGHYPYDQRPVDKMISHLPEYLREIIYSFHRERSSGQVHRFWIEAEEIDMTRDVVYGSTIRIGLSNLKMVVKKHRMERDLNGKLKDASEEDEGWPIYVLSPEQIIDLKDQRKKINGHAMVFVYAERKVIFWENNEVVKEHIPVDFNTTLIRLYKQKKENDGRVILNSKNKSLLFVVTKTMTEQAKLHHRYSPEFIFAHQFTEHYSEFSQYLPEFGRLRELSKMCVLVKILKNLRIEFNLRVQAMQDVMKDAKSPNLDNNQYYQEFFKLYSLDCMTVYHGFVNQFNAWNSSIISKCEENVRQQKLSISLDRNQESSLLDRLVDNEKKKLSEDLSKKLPCSSHTTIMAALSGSRSDIDLIAKRESKFIFSQQLQQTQKLKQNVESAFERIGLMDESKEVKEQKNENLSELTGRCYWVPASIRHEVNQIGTEGLACNSFFVYGGVNIHPAINHVGTYGGPLGGNLIGASSFARFDNKQAGTPMGQSVGAARAREYTGALYHRQHDTTIKSRGPVNGQDTLNVSINFKSTTTSRVGIDYQTGDFVVFHKTAGNMFRGSQYHGHVRAWGELTQEMRNALINEGMVKKNGKISR